MVFLTILPWRWPHKWPKHAGGYLVLELHQNIIVHMLVLLLYSLEDHFGVHWVLSCKWLICGLRVCIIVMILKVPVLYWYWFDIHIFWVYFQFLLGHYEGEVWPISKDESIKDSDFSSVMGREKKFPLGRVQCSNESTRQESSNKNIS